MMHFMPLRNLPKSFKMRKNATFMPLKLIMGKFQNERFDKFCEKFGTKHHFSALRKWSGRKEK